MEKELKNYKVATWILGIVVVVLGIALISTTRKEAASGVEEATMALEKCSSDLAGWIAANPGGPADATAEAKTELSTILEVCSGDTGLETKIEDAGTVQQ